MRGSMQQEGRSRRCGYRWRTSTPWPTRGARCWFGTGSRSALPAPGSTRSRARRSTSHAGAACSRPSAVRATGSPPTADELGAPMTSLVNAVTALPDWAAYLVVIALVFGEAAVFVGLVLPGETALLLALAVVAAVVGDSVGYEVGRRLGPPLMDTRLGRLVGEKRWARAEAVMARRGGWAVLAGRWVGVLRALMPAIAGSTRMPYRRFLVFNAVGGTLWAAVVVVAG